MIPKVLYIQIKFITFKSKIFHIKHIYTKIFISYTNTFRRLFSKVNSIKLQGIVVFVKLDAKPDKQKDDTVSERMNDLLREMEVMTAVVSFSSNDFVVAVDDAKQVVFLNENAKNLPNLDEIISELIKNKKYIKVGECDGAVDSIKASDEVTIYAFRKKDLNGDGKILPMHHEYVRGAINNNHAVFGGIANKLKKVGSELSKQGEDDA